MRDIIFTGVSKSFGENMVFEGFSYMFRKCTGTAIMGPSGSGKTTLVNMMMGLTTPDSGRISGLDGERFSCVFQEDRLIEGETAFNNVAMVFDRKLPESAVLEELKAVGLEKEAFRCVRDFSGGMKRRIAIVRAVMAESDTVIMDEPFKGLDDELKQRVMEYVEDRIGARRLILITHDLAEAQFLCAERIKFN